MIIAEQIAAKVNTQKALLIEELRDERSRKLGTKKI
jgi:hypothetical protein